ITNQDSEVLEKRHFDPWGNITHVQNGNEASLPKGGIEGGLVLDRGYTGHEHLQGVELIHMNGRLYDPKLHRFLAPDNYVQDPYNTQNFNRYGYVYNNPLLYTDPSGEVAWFVPILIGAAVSAASYTITALTADVPFTVGGLAKATVIGAASGAMTFGIGEAATAITQLAPKIAFQALAHGMTQGVMSGIQGGNFWQGAASGALASIGASAWGNLGGNFAQSGAGQITFGTVSGGAGAALTGGNFWEGAATGFVVSALNHVAHRIEQNKKIRERIAATAEKYIGSKKWNYDVAKDNFPAGKNKCNLFCYDVLKEAGASPGLPNGNRIKKFLFGGGYPPVAGQWANPDYKIPGWTVVSNPQRGDVAAWAHNFSDATGHVAIVVENGFTIGTVHGEIIGRTDWGFRPAQQGKIVFRRYIGKNH
ncbi:MAG: RHS repeat-associated core domain-containing protein, partial [Bacteroidota bacterium]